MGSFVTTGEEADPASTKNEQINFDAITISTWNKSKELGDHYVQL